MEKTTNGLKLFWIYCTSSRTLMFNFLLGLVGAIQLHSDALRGFFGSDKYFGLFMIIVAAVGSALRFVTTQPIDDKVAKKKQEEGLE